MLELCGGEGGISQLAFKRHVSSGGIIDKKSNVYDVSIDYDAANNDDLCSWICDGDHGDPR